MDVPATRPEVTTTGIYGEELSLVRQRLLRSDLAWCGDLTGRTQVLIVGTVASSSRKLAVARVRALPCVSSLWVTNGGCSIDSAGKYDIAFELAGMEVCTTNLNHTERSRVQAVCYARHATYSALLTKQCGLLVASPAALTLASPSASSPAAASDKIRFARKHGIQALSIEAFLLRYGVETCGHPCDTAPPLSALQASSVADRDDRQPHSLKGSSGLSGRSNSFARSEVAVEAKADGGCATVTASTAACSSGEVLVCGSVQPSRLDGHAGTPAPLSSSRGEGRGSFRLTAQCSSFDTDDLWRSSLEAMPSIIQPSLASQATAASIAGASLESTSATAWRPLADEFSDVVVYCSPPHHLTTQRHDVLSSMGIVISPQLTPSITHVLVLGEIVEECFFPRPGLQIVSWQWIAQCRLEQRRLSCVAFRVAVHFCPVITFTGLSAADKLELSAALQRSGLRCVLQDALVLGGVRPGGAIRGGDGLRGLPSTPTSSPLAQPCLPRSTTHLVTLRRQLLASQKVAVLAQHQFQHADRQDAFFASSAASVCRLVGVDWVYRSIQQGHWLDAELFTLVVPNPSAFTLAAANATVAAAAKRSRSQSRLPLPASTEDIAAPQRNPTPPTSQTTRGVTSTHCTSQPLPSPPPSLSECAPRSPPHLAEVPPLDDEGAAGGCSQPHETTATRSLSQTAQLPAVSPLRSQRDDDDEEAGGESAAAAAAVRSALQAIHSTPLAPSPAPASFSSSSSTGKRGAQPLAEVFAVPQPLTKQAGGSSLTFLATQYSPTFENLLGELEALPSELLGEESSSAHMRAPVRGSATPWPGTELSAKALETLHGEFEMSPPAVAADAHVQQRALLHRASHHHHQQQQQQPLALLRAASSSSESQFVFYQTGLDEHGGHTVHPQGVSQVYQHHRTGESGLLGTTITKGASAVNPTVTATGISSAPCAAAAVTANTAVGGANAPASSYGRSAAASAVFLITKDVLKADDAFDWDAFALQFPRFERTSKPEECTHFVTAKPSKTEQFLCCLAAGHWILTPAYLHACAAAGYLVSEAPFEWSAEMAAALGCRSSVASLVRGCRVQREAAELPFTKWQVQVCCTSAARADSFLRVLRNGGCDMLRATTAEEVLRSPHAGDEHARWWVLADDTVFTEEELESCAATRARCPILRLEYLVQFLCSPETPQAEMDLLQCVRARKRSRVDSPVAL